MSNDQLEHARVGSWFLGPRAENFGLLKEFFDRVLEDQKRARESIYPDDPAFITTGMQATDSFKESVEKLRKNFKGLSETLAQHSIPFWSPRYNAHMNMDTALPGIVGYMTAMMYNPNNVATEASPFTTLIERNVGDEFCKMLGYNTMRSKKPHAWGHITCGGSVANLEAIWAARNLKFYPLSLKLAMKPGKELEFLTTRNPPFVVENCKGQKKAFREFTTWELLNLKPSTVLDIPTRLYEEYGISSSFLQSSLRPYLIQTVGKDLLEKEFKIKEPAKFFISVTKHYSIPKGGAITGIGSKNFIHVKVDIDARMDVKDLEKQLESCVAPAAEEDRTPVFGVITIMGSTEHGACDPLAEVVKIRQSYEKRGLSFVIHSDAAWGGYFASMVTMPGEPLARLPFVPTLALKPYTEGQLKAIQYADSVTIDPHKSGYINYPAGGLCYRDERMRYLITWTSPIVFHAGDALESIGVYGVEGSKPGASPVATWLTHQTLGLDHKGYGRLLGEAIFTCTKLYCHWATMTTEDSDLIVVPLVMLPAERNGGSPAAIKTEKDFIREWILSVSNEVLINGKKEDGEEEKKKRKEALKLLKELGSDLMINAFACNFKIDGKPNTDVGEANYLNTRIFKRLSVTTMKDDVKKKPLFLTESKFKQTEYGACLHNYKRRLQLETNTKPAIGDLVSLVNVTMSPWPTDFPFMQKMVGEFEIVALEEVKRCVRRNKLTKTIHGFIMQGNEKLFLVHLPMFNMANHRWQLIITAEIPDGAMKQYRELRKVNPKKFYTVANTTKEFLENLVKSNASFKARMDEGIPGPHTKPLAEFAVSNVRVIIQESLSFDKLQSIYPERMPFYLYGSGSECHIDHVLKTSPNAQLNADCISVDVQPSLTEEQLSSGSLVVELQNVFERSLQPLPTSDDGQIPPNVPGLSFLPGVKYNVKIFSTKGQIAAGQVVLGKSVYADWLEINMDPTDIRVEPKKMPDFLKSLLMPN